MMMMFILPLLILSNAGSDMFSMVDSKLFWKELEVQVTEDNMLAELQPVKTDADVDALIVQLGAADFEAREAATEKLANLGLQAKDALMKAQKSDSAEVAERANMLLEELDMAIELMPYRRLMAIRTLGELKSEKALPVLAKLTASKAAFEADYAKQAIAAIKGEKYVAKQLSMEDIYNDIYLMPETTGILGQVIIPKDMKVDLTEIMKMVQPGMKPEEMKEEMAEEIMEMIMETGNFRIDSATFAIAENVGNDTGWVVAVIRGQADNTKFKQMLAKNGMHPDEDGLYPLEDSFYLMPALDKGMLILVGGPNKEALPLASVKTAIKTGKGGFEKNRTIKKLMGEVEKREKSMAWVVGYPSKEMREELPPLAPFDRMRAAIHQDDKGGLHLKMRGRGEDADAVTAMIDEMQGELDRTIKQMEEMKDQMPIMDQLLKIVKSIKLTKDGPAADMEMKVDSASSLMLPMLMWMGFNTARVAPMGEVAPAEAEPAPAVAE